MATEEQLAIVVRLKDQATQEFARLQGTVKSFGRETSAAASLAEQKMNRVGAAASQIGNLIGGTTGELVALGGRGASAVHALAEAFKGPLGLTSAVLGGYAVIVALKPKIEELGKAYEKVLPALNEALLKAISPQNAKDIERAFKAVSGEAATSGGVDPAKRLEAFNKALQDNAAALERAAREAKVFGSDRLQQLGKEIQIVGSTLLTLQDNLDRSDLNQALDVGQVANRLRELQEELRKLQAEEKERLRLTKEQEQAEKDSARAAADALRQQVEEAEKANTERQRSVQLWQAEHSAVVGLRGAFRELTEESTKWGAASRAGVLQFSDALSNNATDALIAFGEQTESERKIFKKFAASVLRDIARIIIQTLVLKAVQAGLGAIGGAFSNSGDVGYDGTNNLADHIGLEARARGAVISGGKVQNFGSGTILTRPTVVGLGRGGLAIGGEAGEEGLFPLRRDRQGRLGISGGAPSVTVNYYSSAVSTAEEARLIQRNAETIAAIVSHKMRSSSSFRDSMRAS